MLDLQLATSDEILAEIGQRLRAQRLSRLITQEELASRAGVSSGALKALESSGRTTMETLVRVVQALSLTGELADLFRVKPTVSIAEMERAEYTVRKRARRKSVG